jgi:hypothetical protein
MNMKATPAELIILNNWRIYYRAMILLEICLSSGQGIQPIYLEYNHSNLTKHSKTTMKWPNQGKPDRSSFNVWKKYIKQCFINSKNKQIASLGAWDIEEVLRISPRWGYYSNDKQTIYIPIPQNKFQSFQAYDIH